MKVLRIQLNKRDIVQEHERKLLKRERKTLEAREARAARELEPGYDA